MLDVVGTTLNDDDIRRLDHPMTGGMILFARHFQAARNCRADRLDSRSS